MMVKVVIVVMVMVMVMVMVKVVMVKVFFNGNKDLLTGLTLMLTLLP